MSIDRPTISDVARRAGVSKGAVSFALNGREGVSSGTRDRILSAARELGWQPSHRARSLSVSRALTFGFVLAREPELIGADPFFPSFIAGVETVLAPAGYALMLQVVPAGFREEEAYRTLASERRVDGVFLSDLRVRDSRISLLIELGLPAVTLNRPDVPCPFPAVCLDDHGGIDQAIDHLAALGHRRIAHVSGPMAFLHARHRHDAWVDGLRRHSLPPGPLVVSDFTAAGGAAATRELLAVDDPPTAIVYANDLMAIAGISVAHNLGVPVPDDLSVVGFDGTELGRHVHPALTTVVTNPLAWGQAAAATLLASTRRDRSTPVADVAPKAAQLRVLASTAPRPRRPRSVRPRGRPTIPHSRPHRPSKETP